MKLKEAFKLIPANLYNSQVLIIDGKNKMFSSQFSSIDFDKLGDTYDVINEEDPFEIRNNKSLLIVFNVKKHIR